MKEILYRPIGVYHSVVKNPAEAGRQPDAHHPEGRIELFPGHQFEQALTGLTEFSHLWVIFQFHHNEHWKPMVLPPRGSPRKVGVFATRSPYRPNNIGLSVVRLKAVHGLNLEIAEGDLLDASPILDIKPYLPYVDAKPEATEGWIRNEEKFTIHYEARARTQLDWLQSSLPALESFIQHQLEYEPTDSRKKRVRPEGPGHFILAYRTWRLRFSVQGKYILIEEIFSGYRPDELEATEDPYEDKDLHRRFTKNFWN